MRDRQRSIRLLGLPAQLRSKLVYPMLLAHLIGSSWSRDNIYYLWLEVLACLAEGRNRESEYAERILREGEAKVAKLTDKDDIEA